MKPEAEQLERLGLLDADEIAYLRQEDR